MRKFLFVLLVLGIYSCEKEVPFTEIDNALSGNWVNLAYPEENHLVMDKTKKLKQNEFGFTFKFDGRVISRSNAGFCGTPPITTKDFQGTWTRVDSTLFIQVDFWGGQAMYRWKILSLSPTKLKVLVEFENYDFSLKNS